MNTHPLRLTNPDALYIEHGMDLGGESVVPIILIEEGYDGMSLESSVFDHFFIAFVVLRDGQLDYDRMYSAHENPNLLKAVLAKVGLNTGYLLHVEEAVAENFAMLAMREKVPDVGKLEQLHKVIERHA